VSEINKHRQRLSLLTRKSPPWPYNERIAFGLGDVQCMAARYAHNPPALDPATAIASGSILNLKPTISGFEGSEMAGPTTKLSRSCMSLTISWPVAGGISW